MSPSDFARRMGGRINPTGRAFMMHADTRARGERAGLDYFGFYTLGRGGVLGNVEPGVVASAFFYFEPSMLAAVWNNARSQAEPHKAAGLYAEACQAWGREHLGGIEDLEAFTKLALRVVEDADVRGLSLFAGWRDMPLPDDAAGRAMQLIHVLRELRGGANGIATRALGLSAAQAVVVNAGEGMVKLFGWPEAPDPELYRERVSEAEDITDEIVGPAFAVLDTDEQELFERVVEACAQAAGV